MRNLCGWAQESIVCGETPSKSYEKFSSLYATEVFKMTTSIANSVENFIKITFTLQCQFLWNQWPKSVKMMTCSFTTNSGATSDENFVKMTIFSFQCRSIYVNTHYACGESVPRPFCGGYVCNKIERLCQLQIYNTLSSEKMAYILPTAFWEELDW